MDFSGNGEHETVENIEIHTGYENLDHRERFDETDDSDDYEEFWTPGPEELVEIRKNIMKFSVKRAYERLELSKLNSSNKFEDVLEFRRKVNKAISKFDVYGSNILSNRAISTIKFSLTGEKLAIGSWSGDLKIISTKTLQPDTDIRSPIKTYDQSVHNKISDVDWYPFENSKIALVGSNSNDLSVLLWSHEDKEPICMMKGHQARITGTKFHPSGKFVASSSYDKTWRFFDIEYAKELYLQEGHSKEVYCLSFQKDGALLATGGLDAIGKIWDLRTGKEIMSLCDHIKDITCVDWSDNSYQLATGSKDGTIKIWDMRYAQDTNKNNDKNTEHIYNDQPLYTIPAHNKLVSDLKFFHVNSNANNIASYLKLNGKGNGNSEFLISSSYDGTIKAWSADNWINLAALRGHTDDKIMSCDISPSGDMLASSGWDKSVRLWNNDNDF